MLRVVESTIPKMTATQPRGFRGDFNPMLFSAHEADIHLSAIDSRQRVLARCSLWWHHPPELAGERVGLIGHYADADDAAAARVLGLALNRLAEQGCTVAVGPMDGNTWRSYRFVTDPGTEPPFFLEPINPPEWPIHFRQAGFVPFAEYMSVLITDLTRHDDRMPAVAEHLQSLGINIRAARTGHVEQELPGIYAVSRISFRQNFLYTPLAEEAFRAQYEKLLPLAIPQLVLIAERNRETIGFLFAIPDYLEEQRGSRIETFIIKTLAILPDKEFRGLGGLLVAYAHEAGRSLGYRRCVHALMHESNRSRNISRHYGKTMRVYTLFSKRLGP